MRSCCGCFITTVVVLSISIAAAIAVTAVLSNMATYWEKDDQRPKIFSILNMLGVITKRGIEYPGHWVSSTIRTRCACKIGNSNMLTDEHNNNCLPNDPCNPGPLPIT